MKNRNHTGEGDVAAITQLLRILERFYGRNRVNSKVAEEEDWDKRTENLVLVGGPRYNFMTGRFLGNENGERQDSSFEGEDRLARLQEKLDYRFRVGGENEEGVNQLIYKRDRQRIFYSERKGGTELRDYGYLVKTKNPFNRDCWLFIIAGCSNYGTGMGAVQLSDLDHIKNIKNYGKEAFQAVVEGRIPSDSYYYSDIQLVPNTYKELEK